jgi:carbon-monoxide dehydrogenase large subunit
MTDTLTARSEVGQSIRRHEDATLVRGAATFVADIAVPHAFHMVVVRSPIAHGTITAVEVDEARQFPGVIAVWTADDVRADLGHVPQISLRVSFDERVLPFLQPVLADGKVRYVGEPVAIVIADDAYTAEDAAELVHVEIDELPVQLDLETASAPNLFEGGDEVAVLAADFGDVDRAFAEAAIVVEATLEIGRHTGVPMETRGLLVEYDPISEGLIVHGSTKVPHSNRTQLSEHLGVARSKIRMRETAIGGGFGVRGEYYPEDFLVAWAAWRLRRPVKWIEDRREHLMAANHSRQQLHHASMAATADGRIIAMQSDFWVDQGAYVRSHGLRVPDLTLSMLPGPYDIASYRARAHCVVSNRTPTATYRAPGRFESSFVRERLIDLVAARCGIDPVEVRRRNLIRPDQLPYRRALLSTSEPVTFSEGDYPALLERVVALIDRDDLARRRAGGEAVGFGLAVFLEKSGLGPWESGAISVSPDGDITVRTGCSSVGQGIRTILAQIAADELGVDTGDVRVELLDTDHTDYGTGSYASRSTATAGSAVHLAAISLIAKAVAVAADHWGVEPSLVRKGRGALTGPDGATLTLAEIAGLLEPGLASRLGLTPGLSVEEHFHVEKVTYPYGVHAAIVSVDRDTGRVDVEKLVLAFDVGRAVNPMLIEGQLHGGAAQAIGGALFEEFTYDEEGNPQATTFMDYLLPTMAEVPELVTVISEDAPALHNPLGVKGAGEGGITGVAAAIAAAVDEALGEPGIVRRVPITPARLRQALNEITP